MNQQNENAKGDRRGKRFISLVRQSSDVDGTTSTEAQLSWMNGWGRDKGMLHADDIILNGMTGSLPGKRDDLKKLISRKRERDDFDVLLVQRCDRLTRGGSDHAIWFHFEATKAGIEVLYPGEDLPSDGSYRGMIMAAKFDAARDQAKSIGQRAAQGRIHSHASGRNCTTSRTPFGCDRLYLSTQGDPMFIIRNLGDGRQQKLNHKTCHVIDTYGRVGGGLKGHYRKQKDEGVEMILGLQDKVEAVRLIFDMHYSEKWGGKRIADLLNRRGIASPTGRGWSQRQVESIYENPIYCGWALGRRTSQGIFFMLGAESPIPTDHDPTVLANCQSPPKKLRPPKDWIWQEQPRMKGMLSEVLAEKALREIKHLLIERWERSQDPTRPKRSTNKHKASEYILTERLFAKQDGASLTGVLCGRVGKKTRYYRHRRGKVGYRKGSVYNKMIMAEPLEQAVLELIREIIVDAPEIRKRVLGIIEQESVSMPTKKELEALTRRRAEIAARVQLIVKTLDEASLKDAKPELDRLADQRRQLDEQIAKAEQAIQRSSEDPSALADRVVDLLKRQQESIWNSTSNGAKRDLVEQFVERVEVDMLTKDAVVSIQLPHWALQIADWAVRLENSSSWQTVDETHLLVGIPLAYANCRYVLKRGRSVCYRCRRRAA